MKKIFLVILFLLFLPLAVSGHQIVTSVYINFGSDNYGAALEENKVFGYININSYNASLLLGQGKDPQEIFPNLVKNKKFFSDYVASHISFTNNGQVCDVSIEEILPRSSAEFFVNGIGFNLDISCGQPIGDFYIKNDILLGENSYQANELDIYTSKDNLLATLYHSSNEESSTRILKENGNYYLDGKVSQSDKSYQKIATGSFGSNFIENVANMLSGLSPSSVVGILLIIVFIGALHSLEGGHNKVILASLMINNKLTFKGSFFYVLIFTITHMSDIIILSIGLLFFNSYINIYEKIPAMREYSVWALLLISSYIIVKEAIALIKNKQWLKNIAKKSNSKNKSKELADLLKTDNYALKKEKGKSKDLGILMAGTFKEQMMVAFISGLAPCLTGWVIFMLIVSSGNMWLLLPALFAFGLGVFIVLMIFAYLFSIFRDQMVSRFNWIAEYAPLVSGIFLLFFSILQI
jgi:ABC-type nickel/cobalt efflux system permease component RcnA